MKDKYSSKAQAENGIDNTTIMTPLRVKQSILVNSPASPEAAQADWNESDSTKPSYIKNKPTSTNEFYNGGPKGSTNTAYLITKTNSTASYPNAGFDLTRPIGYNKPIIKPIFNNTIVDKPLAYEEDVPTKTSDLTNDSNFVSDASYVHTDNNYTTAEQTKLSGIEAGAEQNVQSDWSQSDNTKDDYIKNKPTIPTVNDATLTIQKNSTTVGTFTANSNTATTVDITVPTKVSDLQNDSGFITTETDPVYSSSAAASITSSDITNWNAAEPNVIEVVKVDGTALTVTNKAVDITGKQDTLVSGTNIKTINNQSLLGSGNIQVGGGGSSANLIDTETGTGGTSTGVYIKLCHIVCASHKQGRFLNFRIYFGDGNNGNTDQNAYGDLLLQQGWTGSNGGRFGGNFVLHSLSTSFTLNDVDVVVTSDNNLTYDLWVWLQKAYSVPNYVYEYDDGVTITPISGITQTTLPVGQDTSVLIGYDLSDRYVGTYSMGYGSEETSNLPVFFDINSNKEIGTLGYWGSYQLRALDGTTSNSGVSELILGNNTPRGTYGNTRGQLCLYTDKSGVNKIIPGVDHNNTRVNYLPDKDGTFALLSDIPSIPSVNDGKLTIQQNGTNIAYFYANQGSNTTANITGIPEFSEGTGIITRTSGATIEGSSFKKWGRVAQLRLNIKSGSSATGTGSDCFVGTINRADLYPVVNSSGIGYQASTGLILYITSSGAVNVRVIGANLGASKTAAMTVTYITV